MIRTIPRIDVRNNRTEQSTNLTLGMNESQISQLPTNPDGSVNISGTVTVPANNTQDAVVHPHQIVENGQARNIIRNIIVMPEGFCSTCSNNPCICCDECGNFPCTCTGLRLAPRRIVVRDDDLSHSLEVRRHPPIQDNDDPIAVNTGSLDPYMDYESIGNQLILSFRRPTSGENITMETELEVSIPGTPFTDTIIVDLHLTPDIFIVTPSATSIMINNDNLVREIMLSQFGSPINNNGIEILSSDLPELVRIDSADVARIVFTSAIPASDEEELDGTFTVSISVNGSSPITITVIVNLVLPVLTFFFLDPDVTVDQLMYPLTPRLEASYSGSAIGPVTILNSISGLIVEHDMEYDRFLIRRPTNGANPLAGFTPFMSDDYMAGLRLDGTTQVLRFSRQGVIAELTIRFRTRPRLPEVTDLSQSSIAGNPAFPTIRWDTPAGVNRIILGGPLWYDTSQTPPEIMNSNQTQIVMVQPSQPFNISIRSSLGMGDTYSASVSAWNNDGLSLISNPQLLTVQLGGRLQTPDNLSIDDFGNLSFSHQDLLNLNVEYEIRFENNVVGQEFGSPVWLPTFEYDVSEPIEISVRAISVDGSMADSHWSDPYIWDNPLNRTDDMSVTVSRDNMSDSISLRTDFGTSDDIRITVFSRSGNTDDIQFMAIPGETRFIGHIANIPDEESRFGEIHVIVRSGNDVKRIIYDINIEEYIPHNYAVRYHLDNDEYFDVMTFTSNGNSTIGGIPVGSRNYFRDNIRDRVIRISYGIRWDSHLSHTTNDQLPMSNFPNLRDVDPIPQQVTVLGSGFLENCDLRDLRVLNLEFITTINERFMAGSGCINANITFGTRLTRIGENFMLRCREFNAPIVIPSGGSSGELTIGNNFMAFCDSFNSTMDVFGRLTETPPYFMVGCISFNQPLVWRSLRRIGSEFMLFNSAYNRNINIPSHISIAGYAADVLRAPTSSFTHMNSFARPVDSGGGCTCVVNVPGQMSEIMPFNDDSGVFEIDSNVFRNFLEDIEASPVGMTLLVQNASLAFVQATRLSDNQANQSIFVDMSPLSAFANSASRHRGFIIRTSNVSNFHNMVMNILRIQTSVTNPQLGRNYSVMT